MTLPADLVDRLKHYAFYVGITIVVVLLIMGGFAIWRFIFPKPDKLTNTQKVITTPFSHVDKVDQTSTQVQVTEKPWEVDIGGGVLRYDNKDGWIGGAVIKRKF